MKRTTQSAQYKKSKLAVSILMAIGGATQASAQSSAPVLEEVMVTASKKGAFSTQESSYSVQAFGQNTLEKMGVDGITDFSRSVPGLDVIDVGPSQKTYIIRGVSGPGESTVGVYIDNIPMVGSGQDAATAGGNQPDLGAFDMERVEVLRGPQGTLYGSNSVSGVVRYITNKPDSREFAARVQLDGAIVEHGSPNSSVKGMVNIPLLENTFALRLVGYMNQSGGFIDNAVLRKDASCYQRNLDNPANPGTPVPEVTIDPSCLDGSIARGEKDINSYETTGLRAQLGWEISDASSLLLQYFYQDVDVDDRTASNPYDSLYIIGPPFVTGSNRFYTPAAGELVTNVRSHEPHTDEMNIFGLEFEHDFEKAALTVATSYIDRDVVDNLDSSSPARLAKRFHDTPLGPWGGVTLSRDDRVSVFQRQGTEQFTVEARLASTLSGPVNYLVGAFYQDLETSLHSVLQQTDAQTGLAIPGAELLLDRIGGVDQSSTALFGELYYDLTDSIQLMGGVRWFEMERDQTSNLIVPFVKSPIIGGPPGDQPSNPRSYNDTTFKWQITWRPTDDIQLYLLTADGFRPGGVNAQITPAIPPFFDPDTASSLELGLKTSWMDGRLFANLAVYDITWQDLQMSAAFTTQFNGMVNCTEQDDPASSQGWELELTYQLTNSVTVGANYSRMDAHWDVDPSSCLPPALVSTLSDPIGGFDGQKLIGVPDYSGSAFVDWEFQWTNNITGFIRGDLMFQGEVDVNQMRVERNIKNPAYTLANIRIGAQMDNYELALYVKNVMDEVAYLSMFNNFQQENRVTPSQPRTVGLTFDVKF